MYQRAYSFVTIKGFDPVARTFSGIATSPKADRVNDVIDSKGVKFKNPLPLLLYHDNKKPVGEARFGKATADGTPFDALISSIDRESGVVKERLDEAVDSLAAKPPLIRAVSIGFRPLEDPVYNRETGGFYYPSIEVLELSMVVVPAHQDATIDVVKSIDAQQRAASGPTHIVTKSAGVSASSGAVSVPSRVSMKKTYAEQIADIDAQIQTKQSDLDALQTKVTGEGRTKDAGERESFDALSAEIDALEAEKADLEKLEARAKSAAKPVVQQAREVARTGQPHQVITMKQNREPGIGFARMAMCKMASAMAMQSGNFKSALDFAKERYPHDQELELAIKTSVAGGLTTDSTWAQPLAYAALAQEFIEYLRPQTIIGKFGQTVNGVTYPALQPVPFNVKINRETSVPTGYWVGEGKPTPVSKEAFDQVTMAYTKVGALAVISKELARFSSPSAELQVRNALVKSTVARLDTDFIDPDKAASAGVNPASITNGLTGLTTAGTSADNVRTDIIKLLAAFQTSNFNPANLVLIMPNTLAMALSVLATSLGTKQFPNMGVNGGYLEGIPVIASQYAASGASYGNMVIAVDASSVGLADDGDVTVDISMEASLEMLDNPTNALTPTATSMVSLWQTGSMGIKTERYINWQKMRTGCVQFFDDVNWGAVGSPY